LERVTAEPSYSVPLQSDACDLARQGAEGGWGGCGVSRRLRRRRRYAIRRLPCWLRAEHLQKEKAERGSCCTYRGNGQIGNGRIGSVGRSRRFMPPSARARFPSLPGDAPPPPTRSRPRLFPPPRSQIRSRNRRLPHGSSQPSRRRPPVIPVPAGSASEQRVQFLNHRSTPGTA
jgi:hypothetical protein